MHVVLENPAGPEEDLELQVGREEATVGDLLESLPGAEIIDGLAS